MDLDMFLQSSPACQHQYNDNRKVFQNNQNGNHQYEDEHKHYGVQNIPNNIEFNKKEENMSASNGDSFKRLSSIKAGKKARQKKKAYVQTLEEKVKQLEKQVSRYDQYIKDTKQELSKLVFSAKYNENKLTYTQIQSCISVQDPNEDRINMLMDMIKFRVGGMGIERQAKIEYFMKQLINTLFLPLYRYLLYASDKGVDVFKENSIDQLLNIESSVKTQAFIPWTKDFLASVNLSEIQKSKILKLKPKLQVKKSQVYSLIGQIKQINEQIKQHEKDYETMIDQIRDVLNPVQGGFWLLFTDRIRYRGQIILDSEKELFNEIKTVGFMPSKKLKKQ